MLRVDRVSVSYGKITALDGVSLEVNSGEIVAIVGANGAGKSTLIWTIAGCLTPRSGRITLDGKALPPIPHRAARMGVGISPERRRLFPNLTVRENLMMGAFLRNDPRGIREDEEAVYRLFPVLEERRGQFAGTLSGGEQQMASIARALMSRPRLLLLDEPSLGLSPILTTELFKKISEINRLGTTILLVEQNAFKALDVADRAYVLESGRIKMSGTAAEFLNSQSIREAYLGVRVAGGHTGA